MDIEKVDSEISKLKEKVAILENCIECILSSRGVDDDVTVEQLEENMNKISEVNERYRNLGVFE